MMASEVSICNMALAHLGQSTTIGNLETERSVEANICRIFYETVRDATLRDFAWPFARRREILPLLTEFTSGLWSFSYKYPTDALRVLSIPNRTYSEVSDQRVPFEIQSSDSGPVIFTSMPNAEVEYIKRITDPSLYTADFVMALSFHIAMVIGPQITGADPFGMTKRAMGSYQMTLQKAKATALNESAPMTPPESEFARARY